MWLLDSDYDERSLLPRQVFFPMAGVREGWNKLRRNIRAEFNESRLRRFHGTVSLSSERGANGKYPASTTLAGGQSNCGQISKVAVKRRCRRNHIPASDRNFGPFRSEHTYS